MQDWDVYFYVGTGTTVKNLQLNTTGAATDYTFGTHMVGINSMFCSYMELSRCQYKSR